MGATLFQVKRNERSQQIRLCEANIDRITRELDIYNADLDDLSERMDPALFAPIKASRRRQGARRRWQGEKH